MKFTKIQSIVILLITYLPLDIHGDRLNNGIAEDGVISPQSIYQAIPSESKIFPIILIDILYDIRPTIISTEKKTSKFAIIGALNLTHLSYSDILDNENIYIFSFNLFDPLKVFLEKNGLQPLWILNSGQSTNLYRERYLPNTKGIYEIRFSTFRPLYYLLFLIKGKFYNEIYKEFEESTIKFKNPEGYYPLMVPIFRDNKSE